jgi:hypothetical protein
VRLRTGAADTGKADIESAKALLPSIEAEARQYRIGP